MAKFYHIVMNANPVVLGPRHKVILKDLERLKRTSKHLDFLAIYYHNINMPFQVMMIFIFNERKLVLEIA